MPAITSRCFSFSDIRGDYNLLFSLLTQVMKVAKLNEDQKWEWTVTNTVVVCLGNFVDRFAKDSSFNRLRISTAQAIDDEIRILTTFESLIQNARVQNNNNALVVLVGDHEMGNILNSKVYLNYAVTHSTNQHAIQLRSKFIDDFLKPFVIQYCGLIARWGKYSETYYFTSGGLELDWLKRFGFKTVQKMNQGFRTAVKHNDMNHLLMLNEPESIIYSRKMSHRTEQWISEDKHELVARLSEPEQEDLMSTNNANPKFVLGGVPIQQLGSLVSSQKCKHAKYIKTWTNYRGDDEMYFINNGAADVFCTFVEKSRVPQSLMLTLVFNDSYYPLYVKCKAATLTDEEYFRFLASRPHSECVSEGKEMVFADDIKTVEVLQENKPIKHKAHQEVYLVMLRASGKDMLMTRVTPNTNDMGLIGGYTPNNMNMWPSLKQWYQKQTGFQIPIFHNDNEVKFIDLTKDVRVYYATVIIDPEVLPGTKWVQWNDMPAYANELARNVVCVLMHKHLISYDEEYVNNCPSWLV
jgi:hypothetical protein